MRPLSAALVLGLTIAGGAAGFFGCALETGGLSLAGASSASGSGGAHVGSTSAGSGGHAGSASSSNGATVGSGGHDAGPEEAGPPEAGPVDAGPTFTSCAALLAKTPGAPSGVYGLLDGLGDPYLAYCAMADDGAVDGGDGGDGGDAGNAGGGDGGGWTLVLKIDGTKNTFAYDAALWTNDTGLNVDQPALDQTEAKLASFWSIAVSSLRVGMIENGQTRWLVVPVTGGSLLDMMTQDGGAPTTAGRAAWEGLLAQGSLQTQCNWEGIDALSRVRLGIVGDESDDCASNPSPDSFIGYGALQSFGPPSGNVANYSPDHNDQNTQTFGYVMVR